MGLKDWVDEILRLLQILSWPAVVVAVAIIFKTQIVFLFQRMSRLELPGGISMDIIPSEIKRAEQLKDRVEAEPKKSVPDQPIIPLSTANQRMVELGLMPSTSGLDLNYYRNLIDQDVKLGLASLRIDLEIILKNLAQGFNVPVPQNAPAFMIAQLLANRGNLTPSQYDLILAIMQICNLAVHGQPITREQALRVLELAPILVNDYISWLSWGFPDRPQRSAAGKMKP